MHLSSSRNQGSILVWTVLTISILSLLIAEVIRVVSIKYQNALQSTQWQDALLGAESGIDLAIVELRKGLYPASIYGNMPPFPTASATPAGSWDGVPTADGSTGGHETITIPAAGLANTAVTVDVKVDKPSSILDQINNYQYYRIRSTGTLPLTGPPRVTDNKYDSNLRKLSLQWNRFTGAHGPPQVSRTIEAVVKPTTSFDLAILSMSQLNLTDENIVIDSYDSRSPDKSTNGLYDVTKRQQHGNIATDGNLINAGNAQIYFAGDFSVAGNGIVNSNNQPGDLQLYGIKPPDNVTQTVSLGGNAQLTAAVYAPDANVTVNGSGSSGHVFGSIVGKTVVMNGVTNLHYDEALGIGGPVTNYKIVSWFEDNR